jgi:hypothetical protein
MKEQKIIENKYLPKNKIPLILISLITLASLFLLLLTSCFGNLVIGSGNVISEERQVSDISSISIGSSMNLFIEQTGSESVRIEADDNVISYVTTQKTGGELKIQLKSVGFGSIHPINCYVTVKDLSKIKVSSSATIKCDDLKTENLSIEMASSSKGTLTIHVTKLNLNIGSSADLTLSGETVSQDIKLGSSGRLEAYSLVSKDCKILAQSSGSANINVSEKLNAQISSSAHVNYKGDPEINSKISSSGSLNKASD